MKRWLLLAVCLGLLGAGGAAYVWLCRAPALPEAEPDHGTAWLADVTDEVGLDFVHDAGRLGDYRMPQIVGSGVAVFDFNNDGLLDLYFLQNGGPKGATNKLYQQMPDGRFRDVSTGSGLDIAGYNMGVAVADVNNDGWLDVLVTQYGGIRLFLNTGTGRFVDATAEAGLENTLWATSACFFDYDRDGWLDLVVVNYVDYDPSWPCGSSGGTRDYCAPKVFKGTVTRLFRNLGPRSPLPAARAPRGPLPVRFQDVTVASGLGTKPGPGLGVYCADFTGDDWPDILVANDGQPNHLWVNEHDGTFKEEAGRRGLAYDGMAQAQAGMGIAVGDVDGGGLLDVYMPHLTQEKNTLWKQGPRPGLFQDQTAARGLTRTAWRATGFGTLLADFDHDGALDLAVVNGRVIRGSDTPNPDLGPHLSTYCERNQLLANDGTGHFRDVSRHNPAFCGTPNVARGLAWGVLNGNGAPDLVVTTVAGRARVYRNVVPDRGHWLLVRALDPALHRDADGAAVTVHLGQRRLLRLANPGGSYLCSSDRRAHFGLGTAGRVDAIDVAWPDGSRETFPGGGADRQVILRKGEGRKAD
jgi:hypothetical protein